MKAFITISVVIVSIIGLLGLYISVKGDATTAPVVASVAR